DYSIWRDKISSTIRVFYDKNTRLIQINSEAPLPATADGISLKSTLPEIKSKYKNLTLVKYATRKGLEDYYDDVQKGIAFEFTGLPDAGKKLYAIIVHLPGNKVLPDADEHPIARSKQKR